MLTYDANEALPGVLENRGKGVFISGEQSQILRVTKTILGNREHKKTIFFDFWGTGEQANFIRGTREQVPPWEGLANTKTLGAIFQECYIFYKSSVYVSV